MKTLNLKLMLLFASVLLFSLFSASCSSDDDNKSDIPSDNQADPNPEIDKTNTFIPNAQFSTSGNSVEIEVNLTGIQHPETQEWLKLFGTTEINQNVWVEVDGQPKGIVVVNKASDPNRKLLVDLVFTVDNSSSMGQEADSVANSIVKWATKLDNKGFDIRFGCVGFGYYYNDNTTGGIDFTDLDGINTFLNREGKKGITRTVGFEGPEAERLKEASKDYKRARDECGAEAIRFADENFTFRTGANRIYVNFTDEPNQPKNYEEISVEFFANQENWNTAQGTIHTVYSASPNFTQTALYREYPWLMSEYTGGTTIYAPSNFANVSLDTLPVTGAMENSYIIRFNNNSQVTDGQHEVKVTILSTDGKVKAEKTFKNVKFGN
ncbi:MAG: VWA domain-containing protein [Dysgonomonas sp.]